MITQPDKEIIHQLLSHDRSIIVEIFNLKPHSKMLKRDNEILPGEFTIVVEIDWN